MGEGGTGGPSIVQVKSSGEDPRATGSLVLNLPHLRVNKTKQHTLPQTKIGKQPPKAAGSASFSTITPRLNE